MPNNSDAHQEATAFDAAAVRKSMLALLHLLARHVVRRLADEGALPGSEPGSAPRQPTAGCDDSPD